MTPRDLSVASFAGYPAKARHLASDSLTLLQELPLSFAPFLLKEIIEADVKFPAEMRELEGQLSYLNNLSVSERDREMAPFAGLKLNAPLAAYDWVNSPAQFLEQLSALLWATHQMDSFRSASENYVHKFHLSLTQAPLATHRAAVMVIGQGVTAPPTYPLFVKLRREGTLYTAVKPDNGLAALHSALEERAARHTEPYAHWYVDGGSASECNGFSTVGYAQLAPLRDALAAKMLTAYQASHFDPEMLRTSLARTTFQSLNVKPTGDAALDHFSLTLLTEGSGTQIYSTTFVQWAAREALRRAQPVTLYARYAPRQRERSMDELLGGGKNAAQHPQIDPNGSLIDADMGAYYTWLNQQRLPGAARSRFLVWFENQTQAVVIAPSHKRGSVEDAPTDVASLIQKVLF